MAIVVCSSLILDHRYSFPLLSLQSSISYVLHSIFTHISYHYYSLFASQIPDAKQVSKKESVGWKNWANFIDDYPGSSFLCHVIIHGTAATVLFVNPYSRHIQCYLHWGGFPHSMSFSNSYSRPPMPLSDTGVQVICLRWQSDPLNSLPHSAFWCPGTIYAGVLSCSMFLSMKDSFWSSIMSNNLLQSAAWLFPNSSSQSIIWLFCPLSTVGLFSLGFLFMKDSFWSFIIVQTIFLSRQPDCFQILSTFQCRWYWGVSSQYVLVKYPQ